MNEALAEARRAFEEDEVPVGAIIVHQGEIIARAHNRRENDQNPLAHAEILTIAAAAQQLGRWRLNDCTMIVTLEPCSMCAGALVNSRISMIGFGMYDEQEGCCGSLYQLCRDPRFKHQLTVKGGIMEGPCTLMIQEFFKKQRTKTNP